MLIYSFPSTFVKYVFNLSTSNISSAGCFPCQIGIQFLTTKQAHQGLGRRMFQELLRTLI